MTRPHVAKLLKKVIKKVIKKSSLLRKEVPAEKRWMSDFHRDM